VAHAQGQGDAPATAKTIQNTGSDTLVNLALAWAERYMPDHPDVRIAVTGGGSGTGIAALINGTIDIANASRGMKAETGLPVYRCNRCFNVSYVNLNDVCPFYGCDGTLELVNDHNAAWESNHYRHLYQTLEPISITAEEHTVQWKPDEAGRVQDRFIRGQINVLSCSTTFELGVDVGDLQAVLMRNVPPTTANYIQRAGRAGRRTDSVAFVLIYAQRRSHDLTHFNQPEKMVAGRILPPAVTISNEKIVRRHVHSVFLAAFLRWAKDEHNREFKTAGAFFAPEDNAPSGPALLADYLRLRPASLEQALLRVVPGDLQDALGILGWGWLPQLTTDAGTGILDRAVQEVSNDLALYAELEQDAVRNRRYGQAEHFQRVARTVRDRELLGFLGSHNVLPAYGFPSDVVELRTGHIPSIPEARQIELQRDLKMAIAEYAPGGGWWLRNEFGRAAASTGCRGAIGRSSTTRSAPSAAGSIAAPRRSRGRAWSAARTCMAGGGSMGSS
jgi:hypothetical protein